MRARCYPFNMAQHRFRGKNVKVRDLLVDWSKWITYCILQVYISRICRIYLEYCIYIPALLKVYFICRTVWLLSPPIRTTLATGVLITTLLLPFLTQTACGLCAHNSSSHVLCAPPTRQEVATTSMPKTLPSTWSSSAPLRTLACEQLAQWSQMELGSYMNPHLSPLFMLAGWKTFLGGCHSFLAFLMATPHLLFHTSTLDDRSRPSNSDVLMARALHRAGAAMSMRSTTGCGTLAGPSLGLEDFQ